MLNRLKHLFGDKKNKEFGINNITPIEKIAPKEQIDLIRFFKNELPDSKGRYHKDILQFNHEQIEYNHDFIQWILPTIDKSQFHPEAPTTLRNNCNMTIWQSQTIAKPANYI